MNGREIVSGRHQYPSDITRPGMLAGKVVRPSAFQAAFASLDTTAAAAVAGVTVVHDGDFVGVAAPDERTAARAAGLVKAEWGADGLTVWTGTQRPFGVQQELADAFHLPLDKVRVLMPDCGSGYGGKHTGECAVEAARLARAAGKPVKVVWTREEEFTWAYFRPAGVIDVRSEARKDGTLVAWAFDNYNSGPSAIRTMYEVPNQRIRFIRTKSPLRQGSYRGLAATANHFARESHMDELAHAVGMDPLAFRLKNLKDDRLRAVFQAAADRFGWAAARAASARPGRGVGIAGGFEKGGNVATCAEVEVDQDSGQVKILRLVTAFECGAIVNPDGLRNQVVGAAIMGIGGALFEAIAFDNGRVVNGRLSDYRVPRQSDVPAIEVVLVDRKDLPSAGAGETPIVGAAAPADGSRGKRALRRVSSRCARRLGCVGRTASNHVGHPGNADFIVENGAAAPGAPAGPSSTLRQRARSDGALSRHRPPRGSALSVADSVAVTVELPWSFRGISAAHFVIPHPGNRNAPILVE